VNWQDDPEIQAEMRRNRVRNQILRSAIIWSPFFVAAALGLLFFLIDRAFLGGGHGGTWVLVIVLLVLTVLFGTQSIQSALDLFGKPHTERGRVTRRWSKSDSFVVKSHYMRLGTKIFRGDAYLLADIRENDEVEATYYPHSALLIWVEKLQAPLPTVGEVAKPDELPR
jgi:hypothetical protein